MIRRLALRVGLSCAVAGGALAASSLLATPALVQAPAVSARPTMDTRAGREAARVSALVEEHGCWTDAAPVGAPEPQHAVVTLPGRKSRLVGADVGYEIWLEDRPGTLHGFCP